MKKLKHSILTSITLLALMLAPAATLVGTAYAASCGNTQAAQEVLDGTAQTGNSCNDAPVEHVFAVAVQIISVIVGAAAVIAIIYAGFKYITSGGEASRVGAAKNTLLYAVIGLAVAALAQVMIHFVLFQASDAANAVPKCPSDHHISPPDCHN